MGKIYDTISTTLSIILKSIGILFIVGVIIIGIFAVKSCNIVVEEMNEVIIEEVID